jgi:hypothetical protein
VKVDLSTQQKPPEAADYFFLTVTTLKEFKDHRTALLLAKL